MCYILFQKIITFFPVVLLHINWDQTIITLQFHSFFFSIDLYLSILLYQYIVSIVRHFMYFTWLFFWHFLYIKWFWSHSILCICCQKLFLQELSYACCMHVYWQDMSLGYVGQLLWVISQLCEQNWCCQTLFLNNRKLEAKFEVSVKFKTTTIDVGGGGSTFSIDLVLLTTPMLWFIYFTSASTLIVLAGMRTQKVVYYVSICKRNFWKRLCK